MRRTTGNSPLWVRMQHWVPVEVEIPDPVDGSVLSGVGLRVYGELGPAEEPSDDALVACEESTGGARHAIEYLVTGTATAAHDFETSGPSPRDRVHGGVDVVLAVEGLDVQVQTTGWARDVPLGTRVRIRGELLVIPFYEWTGFDLVDTRRDWAVEETLRLPDGDLMLRVRPLSPQAG